MYEMVDGFEQTVQAARTPQARVDAYLALAEDLNERQPQRACEVAELGLTEARELEYQHGIAKAQQILAFYALEKARYAEALERALEAQHLYEALGDDQSQIASLYTLSTSFYYLTDYERALEYAIQRLKHCEHLGTPRQLASALNGVAILYDVLEDHAQALTYYRSCWQHFEGRRDSPGEAYVLGNIGLSYLRLGHIDEAKAHMERSLERAKALGSARAEAIAKGFLGELYATQGNEDLAPRFLTEALHYFEHSGDLKRQVDTLQSLGKLYQVIGSPASATNYYESALPLAQAAGVKLSIAEIHEALARVCKDQGDFERACYHYEQFHTVERAVFNDDSAKKLKSLQVMLQLERTEREKEIYRLKNIELARANTALTALKRQLERQNYEDVLTGLYNRRYLDRYLDNELKRAERYGHDLSLAMCDIDTFKTINDRFSHAVGDAVLKTLATLIRNRVREVDCVARYGGEEFVIVFSDTGLIRATKVCEQIRQAVESHSWSELQPGLRVTLSIGLASNLSADHPAGLLDAADRRLYEAKQNGKNRVCA